MYIFIFDLDNTLLDTNGIKNKWYILSKKYNNEMNFYSLIKKDKILNKLLTILPYPKYILSNASRYHVINSLKYLGITNLFQNIIDRDITITLKPNLNNYITAINNINYSNIYNYIFFDDLVSNLITAKYIGWITVLIGKKHINHPAVDYSFNNINSALIFFLKKLNVIE